MNKTTTLSICLLIVLATLIFLKIKHKEEFRQKNSNNLMFELRQERNNVLQDIPADGQWHDYRALGQGVRLRRQANDAGILEVKINTDNKISTLKIRIQ